MNASQRSTPKRDTLVQHCWRGLAEAVDDRSHPWRTPAVASRSGTGAALRTVVLRAADADRRELFLHTDARSAKAAELAQTPHLSWLFWDPGRKEQLRCGGPVTRHLGDSLAETHWGSLPALSRVNYRHADAPGTPLDEPGLDPSLLDDDETALTRFLVIRCEVRDMDWLRLDSPGHLRARLTWSASRWHVAWTAP